MSAPTGRLWRPVTLHTRLLAGMLLLLVGGLALSDVAATAELRHFLIKRVDQQLTAERGRFERLLAKGHAPRLGGLHTPTAAHDYVAYLTAAGQVVAAFGATDAAAAGLPPPHMSALPATSLAARGATPFTIPASAGTTGYRMIAFAVPSGEALHYPTSDGTTVAVVAIAAPLNQVDATVADLAGVDIAVSSVVAIVLLLLASGVLRIGLRPITAMARAGQSIAGGNLEQRLPVPHPGSELGRLARTLNQAFDERASSEERLRRFLADASHELRTPLTTVRAWADLYREGGISEPAMLDTAMERIAEESARMGRLVDDLMALARLGGAARDHTERLDVAALVATVVADARIVAADRAIEFSVQPTTDSQDALFSRMDSDDLHCVALNLVTNAIQHTDPGTRIEVQVHAVTPTSDAKTLEWVELIVRDHGAGVPEAERARIFEPFVRLKSDSPSEGTGLGLALVRSTLALYGGTVTVHRADTGGAEFRVRLPAAAAAPAAGA